MSLGAGDGGTREVNPRALAESKPVKSQSIPTYSTRQTMEHCLSPTKQPWRKQADGQNQREQVEAKLLVFTSKSTLPGLQHQQHRLLSQTELSNTHPRNLLGRPVVYLEHFHPIMTFNPLQSRGKQNKLAFIAHLEMRKLRPQHV